MRYLYTVLNDDVGKNPVIVDACSQCGHKRRFGYLCDVLGQILPGDVGKRVFEHRGNLYVEYKV